MALSEDITKRKQAEEALRKSEERWRSVFENSAIGVALTDLNGRFIAVNRAYQEIVGYSEEELRTLVASRQLLWRVRLPPRLLIGKAISLALEERQQVRIDRVRFRSGHP